MMVYSDNPEADFLRHDAERERKLQRLPICAECKEHIQEQEDAVCIHGKWYCDTCLNDMRESIGDD